VSLDLLAGDGEAKSQTAVPAGGGAVQLTERLEELLELRRRDAATLTERETS